MRYLTCRKRSTNPDVDLPPPTLVVERTKAHSQKVVGNLNMTPNVNDYCHWRYTCNFNPNQFPSMIVNAMECTARQGAKCVKRVTKMQELSVMILRQHRQWMRKQ